MPTNSSQIPSRGKYRIFATYASNRLVTLRQDRDNEPINWEPLQAGNEEQVVSNLFFYPSSGHLLSVQLP